MTKIIEIIVIVIIAFAYLNRQSDGKFESDLSRGIKKQVRL